MDAQPTMDDAIPQEFDGYCLVRLIGQGGMGRVYLGTDTLLQRPVAIKFLSAADPDLESRRQFLIEARAIARLQDPCIVAVYRVGEVQGLPYLVSEFVEGVGLDLLPKPVPWQKALRIGQDIARGLAVAHRAGVVHRDIKPANAIQAFDGTVKLLDFGVARLIDRSLDGADLDPVMPVMVNASMVAPAAIDHQSVQAKIESGPVADRTIAAPLPERLEGGDEAVHLGELAIRPERRLGTPAYMAPETWLGQPAGFASDVYSLGALLYALCSGHPPHLAENLAKLRQLVIGTDAEPLARVAPGCDPAFAAVVDRCLRRDPADRFPSAAEVRTVLARLASSRGHTDLPDGNPYRGLRPFEAEHRALYFGRDSEIRSILDRMATDPLVLVAGDSGMGKSSLCRAGVLPRVAEWLGGGRTWSVVTVVPGSHPMNALVAGLSNALGVPEQQWNFAWAEGAHAFGRLLHGALLGVRGVVLLVDPLEEIITLADPQQATPFAEVLGWLAMPAPGVRILSAVRGDFLGRVAALPGLTDVVSKSLFFLRPLSAENLREAITGPAQALGVTFESTQLVETLVRSTAEAKGGLPLLQFAMERLWENRDVERRVVSKASLDALGGVDGALGMHADQVLARLSHDQRRVVRRMLTGLVTSLGTRSRRTVLELTGDDPLARAALDALVQGRLIVVIETADGAVAEVAHEALLNGWATLAEWLSADAGERVLRERIAAGSAEWERLSRGPEALWSGRRLAETAFLDPRGLSNSEQAFLRESRRAILRWRWRLRAAVLAVVVALAATWGGVRLYFAVQTSNQVGAKMAAITQAMAEAEAQQRLLAGIQATTFGLFDRGKDDLAEDAWSKVQIVRDRVGAALALADRETEATLALDPTSARVRSRFAEVLFNRALLAESGRQLVQRDELLARMDLYDLDRSRRARWNQPGRVELTSDPPGAAVTLQRYDEDRFGRMSLQTVEAPPATPWEDLVIPPGSYLAVLSTPGRATTRAPFLLARGEFVQLKIPLLPETDVPPGFVPVPAGRFLVGSAEDDAQRRGFLHAVPLHQVWTGPFLVARYETTFADWVAWLRFLAPAQRQQRLPAVHTGGFAGALVFRELAGLEWELVIKPSSLTWKVRSGEPLDYPGRDRRAIQDWMRFPVTGISAADATAYAAWLASSGQVPGARLCTEWEWERAARGADGRNWPHGNDLAPDDANFDETYGKKPEAMGPDEVGSHPASRSPFGIDDAAGNAWEWTVSAIDPTAIAARGGSFYFDRNSAMAAEREIPEPSFRDVSVGFRVCADPVPIGSLRSSP